MTIFDVILMIILSGFVFYGFFFGFVRVISGIVGLVAGAWVASRYYLGFFASIDFLFGPYGNLGKVVAFMTLFVLTQKIVGFLFLFLEGIWGILSIIPFTKTLSRISGAGLAFLEGALILGLFIYVSSRYASLDNIFGQWLAESQVAPALLKVNRAILPLLPEVLKKIESLI